MHLWLPNHTEQLKIPKGARRPQHDFLTDKARRERSSFALSNLTASQAAQKTPDGCLFSLAHAGGALPGESRGQDPCQGPGWHSMEHSSKMEFFQKLGYDREDVVRVLAKLGQDALVNDVLQELIQTGSRPGAQQSSAAPLLVPRGSCGTPDAIQRGLGADPEEECGDPASSLRPIVIDGSNVAMR